MKKCIFEDATDMLIDNPQNLSRGVTVFDVDTDGCPEILVANQNSANFIYKKSPQSLTWSQHAPANFQSAESMTWAVAPGDFLGNGVPCFYVTNAEVVRGIKKQRNELWLRDSKANENVKFRNLCLEHDSLLHPYASQSVGTLDLKGTGKHSFLVSGNGSPSFLFDYNPKVNEVEYSYFPNAEGAHEMGALTIQSIVSHNSLDVIMAGTDGQLSLFARTRSDKFREIALSVGLNFSMFEPSGIVAADLEGTGRLDLLFTSFDGHPRIFSQNAQRVFEEVTPFFLATGFFSGQVQQAGSSTCVVADFDNDGLDEVLFINKRGPNRLLRYVLHRGWQELDLGNCAFELFEGTGAAVGDFDGDGHLEVFLANGLTSPQVNTVLKPMITANRWIRVLVLTRNGCPAFGARVRVHSSGTPRPRQLRTISSGEGYFCFPEPVAHFGLGAEGQVSAIEVYWPGNGVGIPYTLLEGPFETNQTVTLFPPAVFST